MASQGIQHLQEAWQPTVTLLRGGSPTLFVAAQVRHRKARSHDIHAMSPQPTPVKPMNFATALLPSMVSQTGKRLPLKVASHQSCGCHATTKIRLHRFAGAGRFRFEILYMRSSRQIPVTPKFSSPSPATRLIRGTARASRRRVRAERLYFSVAHHMHRRVTETPSKQNRQCPNFLQ